MTGHDARMIGHDAGTASQSVVTVLRRTSIQGSKLLGFLAGEAMPAKRMDLRMIKDVLRLKLDARLSHERIARHESQQLIQNVGFRFSQSDRDAEPFAG